MCEKMNISRSTEDASALALKIRAAPGGPSEPALKEACRMHGIAVTGDVAFLAAGARCASIEAPPEVVLMLHVVRMTQAAEAEAPAEAGAEAPASEAPASEAAAAEAEASSPGEPPPATAEMKKMQKRNVTLTLERIDGSLGFAVAGNQVTAVHKNGAGEAAGLEVGDLITEVNGKDTHHDTFGSLLPKDKTKPIKLRVVREARAAAAEEENEAAEMGRGEEAEAKAEPEAGAETAEPAAAEAAATAEAEATAAEGRGWLALVRRWWGAAASGRDSRDSASSAVSAEPPKKRPKREEPVDVDDTFAMDQPEPEHWTEETLYTTLENFVKPLTLDQLSQQSIDAKLAKFQARDHIDVRPVYLGFCSDYRNMREYPVTSGSLSKQIEYQFKFMRRAAYAVHDLKDFFEPNPKGAGYVPRKVRVNGQRGFEKMYDIDHIVPKRWGGLDHPRNFVVMHRSMNRSFRDALPEDKMAYINKRDRGILRKVAQFVNELLSSKTVQGAYKTFVETEMKNW